METGTPRVKQTGVVEQSKQMADGDFEWDVLDITNEVEMERKRRDVWWFSRRDLKNKEWELIGLEKANRNRT